MLKNLMKDLKEYIEAHKEEEKKFYEVKKLMLERYSDAVYQQKAEEAQAAYIKIVDELYKQYMEKVQAHFNEAEKAIRSLVMIPIPQDMINTIKIIEELTNPTVQEINAIYEGVKNSYLASKRVHESIQRDTTLSEKMRAYEETGVEPYFIPLDSVVNEITFVKDYIMNAVFAASTSDFSNPSYAVRNVLDGGMIDSLVENANKFFDRYKA